MSSAENAESWQRCDGIAALASPARVGMTYVGRAAEAERHAVKRGLNRGRIAVRWSGAARKNPISVGEASSGRGVFELWPGNRAVYGCSCRESVGRSWFEASSARYRGEPQGEPRWCEVARRGGPPKLTERDRARRATRVRGLSRERHRDRGRLHSAARSSIGPTEGTLDLSSAVTSNRVASVGVLVARLVILTQDRWRRARDSEISRERPRGDRGCQRFATYGFAPSAEGRRGSAANASRHQGIRMQGYPWSDALPSCTTRSRPKLPRRKTVASEGGRRQRELHDPHLGNRRRTKMPRRAASAA